MRTLIISVFLFALRVSAYPPGSPMTEFGPGQVALGVFYDHSGQDLFALPAPSVLNASGINLDYGPWTFLQLGAFVGMDEFDVGVAESRRSDTSAHSFNTGFSIFGGGSGKLATPRFLSNTTRLVAFGSAAYFNNTDDRDNAKSGTIYNAGATVQALAWSRVNFMVGGEYYALQGEQKSPRGGFSTFGLTSPMAIQGVLRGMVGVEYFFKGKNRPFVSVAFRSTDSPGWDDKLGLKNGAISISLGAITSLPGKGKDAAPYPEAEDEPEE